MSKSCSKSYAQNRRRKMKSEISFSNIAIEFIRIEMKKKKKEINPHIQDGMEIGTSCLHHSTSERIVILQSV